MGLSATLSDNTLSKSNLTELIPAFFHSKNVTEISANTDDCGGWSLNGINYSTMS